MPRLRIAKPGHSNGRLFDFAAELKFVLRLCRQPIYLPTNVLPGFARFLLDQTFQLIALSFHSVDFIVAKGAPGFFHAPFELLPRSFRLLFAWAVHRTPRFR